VILICLFGLYFLVFWINNAIARIPFPFPYDIIEDAVFFHALRIYNGLPIFIDPNDGFVPLIYAPGYYYLLCGLFKLFGPSLIIGRIINMVCVIGVIAILLKVSLRKLKLPLAIVPICVYLSLLYSQFAGLQDLARVDPLMVLMIFAGLYLIGDGKQGLEKTIIGIIIFTLSCYVKQTGVFYLPFIYIFLMGRDTRTAKAAIAVSIGLLLGIFLVANALTNNWFVFYIYKLPMSHEMVWDYITIVLFGGYTFVYFEGILYLGLAALIYWVFRLLNHGRQPWNIYEATIPGAVFATIIPLLKRAGYPNDYIPLCTHICFLLPFALSMQLPHSIGSANAGLARRIHPGILTILVCLIMHCIFSLTPWNEYKPTAGNLKYGWDFVNEVKEINGDVFMPSLSYYAWLAGKEPVYLEMPLLDLYASSFGLRPEPLIHDLKNGRYAAICLPEYLYFKRFLPCDHHTYGYTDPTDLVSITPCKGDLCPHVWLLPNGIYFYEDAASASNLRE